ncbi:MAG: ParB/RepB/Spo0J family partition protein [Clostridia bacterium]|nr:ParB/RepB/Spo0J family partition protein [Clostridia bacterium]
MPIKKTGLGRGLDTIFDSNSAGAASSYMTVRLSRLEPRADQPRKTFDEEGLRALADSLAAHGVLQPLLVKESGNGFFRIVAGERRFRAAKIAGLSEVPVIVISPDEATTAQLALVENVQREDLNPVEEALAYRELAEVWELTQEEIAAKIGKSRSAVANMMRLTELPEKTLALLRDGALSVGHAKALLGLADRKAIDGLADQAAKEGWSVRETETAVKRANTPKKAPAPASREREVYARALEDRAREALGRRVKIAGGREKALKIYYEDNEDLEELLAALNGGKKISL